MTQPAARACGPLPPSLLSPAFRHDLPCPPDPRPFGCPVPATGRLGLRMIRRLLTLCFCAIAFWAGMKLQQMRAVDACLHAGGAMRGDDLCTGVAP